jgi:hypothetical protein
MESITAVIELERIRERLTPKAKGFDGTESIRVWRDKR